MIFCIHYQVSMDVHILVFVNYYFQLNEEKKYIIKLFDYKTA